MEYIQKKMSARRCGRVLAAIHLRDALQDRKGGAISSTNIEELEDFLPEFVLVPEHIRQQSLKFANEIVEQVLIKEESLIKVITENSKNRTWDRFYPLDKALLLIGAYSLDLDVPSVMIKEVLISSDILDNRSAAPYLSGILKSIADGKFSGTTNYKVKKNMKLKLKESKDE